MERATKGVMMDIKGMYQEEAENIAYVVFGVEFYDLTKEQQQIVYSKAIEEVHDKLAGQADMLRDRIENK